MPLRRSETYFVEYKKKKISLTGMMSGVITLILLSFHSNGVKKKGLQRLFVDYGLFPPKSKLKTQSLNKSGTEFTFS